MTSPITPQFLVNDPNHIRCSRYGETEPFIVHIACITQPPSYRPGPNVIMASSTVKLSHDGVGWGDWGQPLSVSNITSSGFDIYMKAKPSLDVGNSRYITLTGALSIAQDNLVLEDGFSILMVSSISTNLLVRANSRKHFVFDILDINTISSIGPSSKKLIGNITNAIIDTIGVSAEKYTQIAKDVGNISNVLNTLSSVYISAEKLITGIASNSSSNSIITAMVKRLVPTNQYNSTIGSSFSPTKPSTGLHGTFYLHSGGVLNQTAGSGTICSVVGAVSREDGFYAYVDLYVGATLSTSGFAFIGDDVEGSWTVGLVVEMPEGCTSVHVWLGDNDEFAFTLASGSIAADASVTIVLGGTGTRNEDDDQVFSMTSASFVVD